MKILELKDIIKKDMLIHYRRVYDATAVVKMVDQSIIDLLLTITIEQSPLGHNDITVDFNNSIDYPLVPAMKKVKTYIADIDSKGMLPD